ncbi:MAG: hypothetical protein ISR65_00680 [Bacteriovoracaceae bacterium]|nr:hypothetical protein [Bacteriovoracaceae bacterium]
MSKFRQFLPVVFILVSISWISNSFGFEGRWYSENGSKIDLVAISDSTLIGSTYIHYVDQYGDRTGKKIEYHFSFDFDEDAQELTGQLKTFDEHYRCLFNNGDVKLIKKHGNKLQLIFPKIVFSVQEFYNVRTYLRPVYCHYRRYRYPNWLRHPYICGQEEVEVSRDRPFKRQCVIKDRFMQSIYLSRD